MAKHRFGNHPTEQSQSSPSDTNTPGTAPLAADSTCTCRVSPKASFGYTE